MPVMGLSLLVVSYDTQKQGLMASLMHTTVTLDDILYDQTHPLPVHSLTYSSGSVCISLFVQSMHRR